jgi:hypothetical protein
MPKLANYLGKTIYVSVPAFHDGGEPRAFTLLGVEDCGLWLDSANKRDSSVAAGASPLLVPFAHIAYVTLTGAAPAPSVPAPASGEPVKQPTGNTKNREDKPRNETRRKR